ncbi:MAG: hypothetical protein EXS31_13995 [Pedosphaera sp.]|nr:hypothetical protein [Pedosphaera sp.]
MRWKTPVPGAQFSLVMLLRLVFDTAALLDSVPGTMAEELKAETWGRFIFMPSIFLPALPLLIGLLAAAHQVTFLHTLFDYIGR